MNSLSVYIPMDRRQALARHHTLPDRATGAVLLVDLSDFTPFTYTLFRELGPRRGAEELTRQLNRLYESLIVDVHRYRGSVVALQGDGFVCWFDGDDGRCAASCALGMQKTLAHHSEVVTPGGECFEIALKLAVAAGTARRFVVGHPAIQRIDVLSGSLLDRVAAAEKVMRRGEILVGAEIMGRLGNSAVVREWRKTSQEEYFAHITGLTLAQPPQPWPPLHAVSADGPQTQADSPALLQAEREWLLPSVYQRLARGEEAFLAELRTAVPLFIHFEGIEYDTDDAAGAKLNAYVSWVQSVLAHYGGTLLELNMGDKGGYLYAVFGAPITYEDNAGRAVEAALALRTPLPALQSFITGTRMGISQGLMRVGSYGSEARRSYAAQGAEANLAARLMEQAAPNQILVSPHVADALQVFPHGARYNLEKMAAVAIKGVDEPMAPFAVQNRADRSPVDASLTAKPPGTVGRSQEQATLERALDELVAGESRCVVIEGEAGIGKSQLVLDLLLRARSRQLWVLQGTGDSMERTTTFHAWRTVFTALLTVESVAVGSDSQPVRARIRERFQQHAEILARLPLLSAVLPLEWPDNDLTAQMFGAVRADNTRDLLLRVLAAMAADEPLVLILEDVHWLDSASWQLALDVQRQLPHLLLVLVARPLLQQSSQMSLPDEYRQLLADPGTVRLQLQPLPRTAVADLLRQTLEVAHISPRLLDFVYEQAEGHPLYSQEIVYALREAELLRIEGDRCIFLATPDALSALDFLGTVNGVINSRIDRLSPEQQFVLKVASVIGRTFAVDTLRDVHPIPQDQPHIDDHLQALTHLDVTHMDAQAQDLSYLFKHVLTQEVVYNRLLFNQRSRLHRAVAEWLEQNRQANLSAYYPLLAHHWHQAARENFENAAEAHLSQTAQNETVEKAVHYLELAAEHAMRNGAYAEVTSFLERAIELAQHVDKTARSHQVETRYGNGKRARWHRLLAEALYGMGRPHDSRDHFHQALARAHRGVPVESTTLWRSTLLHGVHHIGYRLLGGVRRPRSADSRTRRLEAALAYEGLAKLHYYENEMHGAIYAILRGFNLAVHAESTALRLRFYANIGMVYTALGAPKWMHLGRGRIEALEAEVRERDADLATLAHVLLVSTLWRIGIDPWDELESRLEQALALFQQLRDRRQWGDCLEALGFIHTCHGAFGSAITYYEQLYELGLASDNVEHQTLGLFGQARVQLRLGNFDSAERMLNELLPYIQVAPHARLIEFAVRGALAMVYVCQERYAQAAHTATRLRELAQQMSPLSVFAYEGYVATAEVSIALWRQAQTEAQTETAPEMEPETKLEKKAAQTQRHEAVRSRRAEALDAVAGLGKFARSHRIGQPRLRLYRGQCACLQGHSRRAERIWQQGLRWAERLDMPYEAERLHAELARVQPKWEQVLHT